MEGNFQQYRVIPRAFSRWNGTWGWLTIRKRTTIINRLILWNLKSLDVKLCVSQLDCVREDFLFANAMMRHHMVTQILQLYTVLTFSTVCFFSPLTHCDGIARVCSAFNYLKGVTQRKARVRKSCFSSNYTAKERALEVTRFSHKIIYWNRIQSTYVCVCVL